LVNQLYYKLSDYLKARFFEKVWKVSVDAGFSCPNREGYRGGGGCIYCSVDSFDGSESGSIRDQVLNRIEKLKKKKIFKYIVYFQSYSNTYAELDVIKDRIEQSLADDGIVALHVGTRPDVIDCEKLAYFKELNEKYEVVIEYGLQSANNSTLELINRGHLVEDFIKAVELTHSFGIKTCAHLIFGLPGDTREDMLNSIHLLNKLGVHSVKFHHLHVVRGTKLAEMFQAGELKLLSEDEYISVLAEAIGLLDRDIVISRIVGDAGGDTLIAPDWPENKSSFERKLTAKMESMGITQGSLKN